MAILYTENEIVMHAPLERVYQAAAEVEHWPRILSHYRFVRDLPSRASQRTVEMSAYRDFIPTYWASTMQLRRPSESDQPRVIFRHIAGVTKGMYVEWQFQPQPDGVHVRITHEHPDFRFLWLVRGWLAQQLIGNQFVHNIAAKTLRGIKAYVEGKLCSVGQVRLASCLASCYRGVRLRLAATNPTAPTTGLQPPDSYSCCVTPISLSKQGYPE